MDLETLLSYDWSIMTPEFIILITATILSLSDLFLKKSVDRRIFGWIGFAAVLLAIGSLLALAGHETASILYDTFRLDSFGKAFKLLLLTGSAFVMLLAVSYQPKEGMGEYKGEFYYLFLTALLGAMMLSSSGDLITMFIGLELLTISSYILAGIRKKHLPSNEAAMKYVINGSISSAVILFAMSYIYGFAGTTNLKEIAVALSKITDEQYIYILGISFFVLFVGVSFKIATAPFHMWAPDVYQGAPTPVTAFLSVVSKTAGFVLLLRVVLIVYMNIPAGASGEDSMKPLLEDVQDYIAVLAALTMIIGNVVALRQKNVKRLFAYSSIAHAGYLLAAFTALSAFMFDAIWFYLGAYLLMNLGAFAIIQWVTDQTDNEDISQFAGLYRKSPVLAAAMGVFILSLAGIPGTAGFIGKLNIFIGMLVTEPAHFVLAAVMIATTVVSYVYYFRIFSQIFFRSSASEGAAKAAIPAGLAIVIGVSAVASIIFGVFPNIGLDFLHTNFNGFSDFLQ